MSEGQGPSKTGGQGEALPRWLWQLLYVGVLITFVATAVNTGAGIPTVAAIFLLIYGDPSGDPAHRFSLWAAILGYLRPGKG